MVICITRLKDALALKDCIYITPEFRYVIRRGKVSKMEVRLCAK